VKVQKKLIMMVLEVLEDGIFAINTTILPIVL